MSYTKEQNRSLCEKYPFIITTNLLSGKRITDYAGGAGVGYWPGSTDAANEYDYEYTDLDSMTDGWRSAFCEQLCEELNDELEKAGALDSYRIIQIKRNTSPRLMRRMIEW